MVVLVVVLLKLPGETVGRMKLALSGLFLPLVGLTGSVHQLKGTARETLTSKREVERENEQLRQTNQALRIQLQQDVAVWNENQRLRSLVGWPRQVPWKVRLARVIARDPANWWRSVEIDLGSRDGVKPNAPVLIPQGLVGRVQAVGANRSQVILLGNPELRVAAAVRPSNETGVINSSSSSPSENDMVDLDYLSGASNVRPGQNVVTWGEGGIFPANIPIGYVVDLRAKEFGLATEARVKLWADMGSLEEVWVIMP